MKKRPIVFRQAKAQDHLRSETSIEYRHAVFFREVFKARLLGVGERYLRLVENDVRSPFGFFDQLPRGVAVGFDETSGAELYAPEITNDEERAIEDMLSLKMHEDRFACGAGRLARIVKTNVKGVVGKNAVGEGHVIGIREFPLQSLFLLFKLV